jgi:hypothetical protein
LFPDGPASPTVSVTVSDSDGASDSDTLAVAVANVAPTVTPPTNQTASEGTGKSFNLGNFTDPGADGPWTVIVNWGDGLPVQTFADSEAAAGAITARSHTYADNGTFTVTVMVRETGGAGSPQDSDTFDVVVANVAPVVNSSTAATFFEFNQVSGQITAHVEWSDVGVLDSQTVKVEYKLTAGTTVTTHVSTFTGQTSSNSLTDVRPFSPGCYTIEVKFSTVDKDGSSSNVVTRSSSSTVDFFYAAFKAPIKNDERNIAKYGNVVPVKVQLNSTCSGLPVTVPTLHLTVAKGVGVDEAVLDDPNFVADNVNNPDTGSQMRVVDSMYMYNLATRGMEKDTDYTIRIRSGSASGPIILKAAFLPKK